MPICPNTGARVEVLAAPCGGDRFAIREQSLTALKEGDQLLGRCLGRNFAVVHVLGHGMMGTVYEAVHMQLERQCAIKVLRPELVSQHHMHERFRREAKAIARLNHPNLVKVYDYDVEADGTSYIAMEFVESQMLDSFQPYDKFSLGVCLHILLQLLAALGEAHSHSVVHRDLKPENLAICRQFVGHPYFVKVLDFGLAKLMETNTQNRLTMAGEVLGTPLYMSPEQAVAVDEITHSTDIYAFGAMAFELLTGKPPFDAPTSLAIMMQHVNAPIPEVTPREGIQVSEALCSVIHTCLAKKPEARYPTVLDVISALESTPEVKGLYRNSSGVTIHKPGSAGAGGGPGGPGGQGGEGGGMFGRVSGWFRGSGGR